MEISSRVDAILEALTSHRTVPAEPHDDQVLHEVQLALILPHKHAHLRGAAVSASDVDREGDLQRRAAEALLDDRAVLAVDPKLIEEGVLHDLVERHPHARRLVLPKHDVAVLAELL